MEEAGAGLGSKGSPGGSRAEGRDRRWAGLLQVGDERGALWPVLLFPGDFSHGCAANSESHRPDQARALGGFSQPGSMGANASRAPSTCGG